MFYRGFVFAGIVLSAILSLSFLAKAGRNRRNFYLSVLLFLFSLIFALNLLSDAPISPGPRTVVFLNSLTVLLMASIGPLILFYYRNGANLLYLLPAGALLLSLSAQQGLFIMVPELSPRKLLPLLTVQFYIVYLYMFFCFVKTLVLLAGKEMHGRKERGWLAMLTGFLLAISLSDLICRFAEIHYGSMDAGYQIIDMLEVCFIVCISFYALIRPDIAAPAAGGSEKVRVKYGRGKLSVKELEEWDRKLRVLMESRKPYLNEISLPDLAAMTGISPHRLSQLINKKYNANFRTYINRLRIADVIQWLQDPALDGMTILELSLKAGFSSKSVFNRAFKDITGKTPTSYRKKSPVL